MSYKPKLKEDYSNSVVSALMKKSGYKNIMQVPKLNKIVISRGVGAAVGDKKFSVSSSLIIIYSASIHQPFIMLGLNIGCNQRGSVT